MRTVVENALNGVLCLIALPALVLIALPITLAAVLCKVKQNYDNFYGYLTFGLVGELLWIMIVVYWLR